MRTSHPPDRRLACRLLLAGLSALAFHPACAITRGVVVSEADFAANSPWVVVVASQQGPGLCTGVLVSPRFVLTAGHCTGEGLEVLYGSPSRAAARRVAVREAILHPRFRREPVEYDLGLLRLVHPVRVTPVPVASRAEAWSLIRPHAEATIMGWGSVVPDGDKPDVLRRASVLFTEIRIMGTHIAYWSERGGPCGGDSGGPMVLPGYDDVPVLVGIASLTGGNLCSAGGGMAAYTDVSSLLDFIREHVADLPERLPPVEFGRSTH